MRGALQHNQSPNLMLIQLFTALIRHMGARAQSEAREPCFTPYFVQLLDPASLGRSRRGQSVVDYSLKAFTNPTEIAPTYRSVTQVVLIGISA